MGDDRRQGWRAGPIYHIVPELARNRRLACHQGRATLPERGKTGELRRPVRLLTYGRVRYGGRDCAVFPLIGRSWWAPTAGGLWLSAAGRFSWYRRARPRLLARSA